MDSDVAFKSAVSITLLLIAGAHVGPVAAHPPSEPDHGVNETLFPLLWSGDQEGEASSGGDGKPEIAAINQLANGTDVPFNSPPDDVATWNAGELGEFPSTDSSVSIRPERADVESGRFLKDAHVSIFAVQPSTRAWLSESHQPLYVGNSGTVLGALDYRIELPEDDTTGDRQVYWSIADSRFEGTTLSIDGETIASSSAKPTWSIPFEDTDPGSHSLTVEADVSVKIEEHVRTEREVCKPVGNRTRCRTVVSHEYRTHDETVSVRDRIAITGYELDPAVRRATYPDGDTGLVVSADVPWLGYSHEEGAVYGTWRFFTSRDPGWDDFVVSSKEGQTTRHSPLHPLQVNAFPFEMAQSATLRNASVLSTSGERRRAPDLPSHVSLDVLEGWYAGSEQLITRLSGGVPSVIARGLVDEENARVDVDDLDPIEVHLSNLTLTVTNETASEVTLTVTLHDEATEAPIETADRNGYVVVSGERVNTGDDGTASITLERTGGAVTARYVTSDWWDEGPGYVGDSQTIHVGPPSIDLLETLYGVGLPAGLFLLNVFLLDRVTRWQLWPPWRGM